MKAIITVHAETNEVTITLQELDWAAVERQSFYEGEGTVQAALRVAGRELTARLLRRQAVAAPQVEVEEQIYYRKAASVGHYQTLYGPLAIERHLYQTSAGGATRCPLEERCQLQFGAATPRLAEVIAFKLASATAREVAADLAKSHGLVLSASYLQSVAQAVGAQAVAQRQAADCPPLAVTAPVGTIATGVDGTTMPLVGEGYKEAMCGTVALYEAAGERLTTEYHGALPQAGKRTLPGRSRRACSKCWRSFRRPCMSVWGMARSGIGNSFASIFRRPFGFSISTTPAHICTTRRN